MICYLATAHDGRRYVGVTKLTLEDRRAQHERDARAGRGSLFQQAIRKFGPESFAWEVLAEGREDVIGALEGALISLWNLTGWREGFNGQGGLYDFADEPPVMEEWRDFEHDLDSGTAEMDMMNDLGQIVDYIENRWSGALDSRDGVAFRKLGERLVRRADQLEKEWYGESVS